MVGVESHECQSTLRTGESAPNRRINSFSKALCRSVSLCWWLDSSGLTSSLWQNRGITVPGHIQDNVSMLGIRVILGVDLLAPLTNTDQRGGDVCCDVHIHLQLKHTFARCIQVLTTHPTQHSGRILPAYLWLPQNKHLHQMNPEMSTQWGVSQQFCPLSSDGKDSIKWLSIPVPI